MEMVFRDSFGGGTIVGDLRWAGAYGIQADFVARSHCSIEVIKTADIKVFVDLCLCHVIYPTVIMTFLSFSQAILEKFEFFPVKCRIQRAVRMYSKFVESLQQDRSLPLKSKVLLVCVLHKQQFGIVNS
jgi:hypothetical protein